LYHVSERGLPYNFLTHRGIGSIEGN
jgi:hypothetical protein